jgi:hypothetical protein
MIVWSEKLPVVKLNSGEFNSVKLDKWWSLPEGKLISAETLNSGETYQWWILSVVKLIGGETYQWWNLLVVKLISDETY